MKKPRYYRQERVSLWRAAYWCYLGLFKPEKFLQLTSSQPALSRTEIRPEEPAKYAVRRALVQSLLWVVTSVLIGFAGGRLLLYWFGCAPPVGTLAIGSVGAGILLWATLFVRGWHILTMDVGRSPAELVDAWLFRCLYCVGTAVIIVSLSWQQCSA